MKNLSLKDWDPKAPPWPPGVKSPVTVIVLHGAQLRVFGVDGGRGEVVFAASGTIEDHLHLVLVPYRPPGASQDQAGAVLLFHHSGRVGSQQQSQAHAGPDPSHLATAARLVSKLLRQQSDEVKPATRTLVPG